MPSVNTSYIQLWKKEERKNTLLIDGEKCDIIRYIRISLGITDRKNS